MIAKMCREKTNIKKEDSAVVKKEKEEKDKGWSNASTRVAVWCEHEQSAKGGVQSYIGESVPNRWSLVCLCLVVNRAPCN